MEVTVVKGRGNDVRALADHVVIAERGVRHGKIVYLPGVVHDHGDAGHSHDTVRPAAKTDKEPLKRGSSKALEM
jgi:NikR C terminal nickel binding domain